MDMFMWLLAPFSGGMVVKSDEDFFWVRRHENGQRGREREGERKGERENVREKTGGTRS